jgi:hypothetical protein
MNKTEVVRFHATNLLNIYRDGGNGSKEEDNDDAIVIHEFHLLPSSLLFTRIQLSWLIILTIITLSCDELSYAVVMMMDATCS